MFGKNNTRLIRIVGIVIAVLIIVSLVATYVPFLL